MATERQKWNLKKRNIHLNKTKYSEERQDYQDGQTNGLTDK